MLFKSLPRSDYLGMLKNCKVLVGNSSGGIIEASYFKCLTLCLFLKYSVQHNTIMPINSKN